MRINNAFHASRVGRSAYTFDNAVPKGKTSRKNASAFVSISGATKPSTFAFSMVCWMLFDNRRCAAVNRFVNSLL